MADNATKRNKPISVDEREEETPTIRKFRVICSNPGATNCSTDEEGKSKDQSSESNPTVREILFGKVDHCDHTLIHSKNGHKNPERISVRSPRKLYKGVYQRKSGRWVSEIRNPITKARVWLGTFNTAEEASNAYLSKELEFKQETQPIVSKDTAIVTSISPIGNGETIRGNTMEAVKEEVNNEGLVVGQKLPIQGVEKPRKPHGRVQVRKSGMWASRQGDQNPRKPYKGVYLRKSGRWRAIIKNPIEKVRVSLGTFNTAEEASNAYLSMKLEFQAQLKAKQDKKLIIGSEREPINGNSMKPVEEKVHSGGLVVGQHLPIQGGQRVNLGLELGSKIIDNYGYLLGEFSSLDDLSICDIE